MSDAARETTPQPPSKPADEEPPSRESSGKPWFSGMMSLLGGFLGGGRKEGDVKESIEDILEEEDAEAELSPKERAMLRNLLKFGELKVADIMMPRADIVAVEVSSSFDQVMAVFAEAQHSRMPVFRETLDAPLGMIHLKDMIPAMASAEARASFDSGPIASEIDHAASFDVSGVPSWKVTSGRMWKV